MLKNLIKNYPIKLISFSEINKDFKSIDELPDGKYKALWYGYILELEDGTKYKTKIGVRQSRNLTSFKDYLVKDGKVTTFSGMAEFPAVAEGKDYGRKPISTKEVVRLGIDPDFHINVNAFNNGQR